MRQPGCQPREHHAIDRRELLRVGALSLFGTGLSDLLRLTGSAAASQRQK